MEILLLISFGVVWVLFPILMVLHAMVQADMASLTQPADASFEKEA